MKATINGTRYDTGDCRELASFDHHSYSGNYAGTTYLLEAGDGELLVWTNSNGQDCHICDNLQSWDSWAECDRSVDMFDNIIDEDRMVELKLIKICPPVKED